MSIFTRTSCQLSVEFVALIAADKLAVSLVKIRDETGVEVNQNDKTFNIQGHWTDVLNAHDYLETTFSNEIFGKKNKLETLSEVNPDAEIIVDAYKDEQEAEKQWTEALITMIEQKNDTKANDAKEEGHHSYSQESDLKMSENVTDENAVEDDFNQDTEDLLNACPNTVYLNFVGDKTSTVSKSAQVEIDSDIRSKAIVDDHKVIKDDQLLEKQGNKALVVLIKQENDTIENDAEGQCSNRDNIKSNFDCNIYEKSFTTKNVLTCHVKSEHMGIKKSYVCPTCGCSFQQKHAYELHANVHVTMIKQENDLKDNAEEGQWSISQQSDVKMSENVTDVNADEDDLNKETEDLLDDCSDTEEVEPESDGYQPHLEADSCSEAEKEDLKPVRKRGRPRKRKPLEINPKQARHAAEDLMVVKTRMPRGRKPGSSINRNRFKSELQSPMVECLQSYTLSSHTNEKEMLTAQLCLHKMNFCVNKKATAKNTARLENNTDRSSKTMVDAHKDDQQGNDALITLIKQEHDMKDDDEEEEGQRSNSLQSDVKMSKNVTDGNANDDDLNQETEDSLDDCPNTGKVEEPESDYYQPHSDSETDTTCSSEAENENVKPVRKRRQRKKPTACIEPLLAHTNVPEMNANHDFRCDLCEYVGKRLSNLESHKRRMHRHRFTCENCNKKFGSKGDYLRHITIHLDPAFSCYICDRQYKSNRAYKEHMQTHEEDYIQVIFDCNICTRRCKSQSAYEEHLQTHKEDYVKPNLDCNLCEKSFITKGGLDRHIKIVHLGLGIKKDYVCPTCGHCFKSKQAFVQHGNIHTGIKPFVCEICGKCFPYEGSLKQHKYLHEDVCRFECNICKKTFKQRNSLRLHLKTHSNQKDCVCPVCGKGFNQKNSLERHKRIHSGEKPFLCTLCSKTFNDSSIIRRHMILLHKKDPKDWRNGVVSRMKLKKDRYVKGVP